MPTPLVSQAAKDIGYTAMTEADGLVYIAEHCPVSSAECVVNHWTLFGTTFFLDTNQNVHQLIRTF